MEMPDWSVLAALHGGWMSDAGSRSDAYRFLAHLRDHRLISDDPLHQLAAAIVALAPVRRPAEPPAEIWERLVSLLHGSRSSALDLAVAVGCGWRRPPGAVGDGWSGRWSRAVAELVVNVRHSLAAANPGLATVVPAAAVDDDDLMELPSLFAMNLLRGCDCGHHVRGCAGREHGCCYPPHALDSWDPSQCTLRAFIDQAVRGSARTGLQGGAFAESMLYRVLEAEGRLLRRRVEFCRCGSCGTMFEGAACTKPDCETPRTAATERVARANWLVTAAHEGGDHVEAVRWICGGCGNLIARHQARSASCPKCQWQPEPGVRPTSVTVWVRLAPERVLRAVES